MKKKPANRSAFFNPRALITFAFCAIGLLVSLVAFALYPGGNALAQPEQAQSSAPGFVSEHVNVAQGTVVSIREVPMPLAGNGMFDTSVGQPPLVPHTFHPSESDASVGTVTLNVLPVDPNGPTPTPTPAGSMVLLDTFTGQPTLTFTGSVPRTYMGDGFTNNVLPGGTTYVSIRSYTFYMIAAVVANYTDIRARLQLWNTYVQTATAVPQFSNPSAFFDVDLGPVNVTSAPVFYEVTVTVLPPFPFLAGGAGTQWGYAQNFQGSTTGGAVADDTNLTSLITANAGGAGAYPAGQITTGTTPNFAYFRNASSEVNFNFLGTSSRTLGLVSQGVGIIIRGDLGTGPTPTPAPTGTPPGPTPTPGPTLTPSPTPTATPTPPPTQCDIPSIGFEDFADINTLAATGWVRQNNSQPLGVTGWFQGVTSSFSSQAGAPTAYIAANFQNGSGLATQSNWLLTPPITLQTGAQLSFWTRTVDPVSFPDRLKIRMSINGASSNVGTLATDVGDFTTQLLDINPTYSLAAFPVGYPTVWTNVVVTLPAMATTKGRLAFHYFVENGGTAGSNGDFIGIDTVRYDCDGGVGPTPTPGTPTPTPTATATPTPIPPTPTPPPTVCDLTEGYDLITTLPATGWVQDNNSTTIGSTGWFQGSTAVFVSHTGAPDSYIGANFNNTTGTDTISNWLLTPPITLQTGGQLTFWTRTVAASAFPDRLQVRMSTNGNSSNVGTTDSDVGDFTTLLLDINPTLTVGGYPEAWTLQTVTLGAMGPLKGRLAFRYFVTNAGPLGDNSNYIGIDTAVYACGVAPTPTPSVVSVTGTVTYCTNPALPAVSGVTMSLTGAPPAPTSVLTNGSGVYTFPSLNVGSSYTITPTKATKPPGTSGINTSDSIAIQRHFLGLGTPLTGCRLLAADTNDPPNGVATTDAIAAQRFFLGLSTGIAQTGRYKFSPASISYAPILANQTSQNYNAVILGDAATAFVAPRPGGPEPDAAIENEIASTVSSVTINRAGVSSSAIDAKSNLVGFQGDFTFDERVITLASQPVSNAGLTAGNWNVSANVLDGPGPIRTLRVSAFSLDGAPLSGTGVLFNLNVVNVDKAAQGAPLVRAPAGEPFVFIDANLNTQRPGHAADAR